MQKETEKTSTSNVGVKIWLLISFVLIAISTFFTYFYKPVANEEPKQEETVVQKKATSIVSYVLVDINPSIELAVNENDQIVEVNTLNEDADIAYSDLDLVGQTLATAVTAIADTAIEMGYLNEFSDTNAVSVTSASENPASADKLNTVVSTSLDTHFLAENLPVLVVLNGLDDALKAKADTYSIPYGKMLLVARAMKLDTTLVETSLVKMSVKEIHVLIKTKVKARIDAKKAAMATAKQTFDTLKKQKIEEYKTKRSADYAALVASAIKEKGRPLTEAEKQEIVAKRRTEIKAEIDAAKADLKSAREARQAAIREKYLAKTTM